MKLDKEIENKEEQEEVFFVSEQATSTAAMTVSTDNSRSVDVGVSADDVISIVQSSSNKPSSSVLSGTIHRRALQRLATDVSTTKRFAVPEQAISATNPAWYTKNGLQAYEKSIFHKTWQEWLVMLFPIVSSLKGYNFRETFPKVC